MEHINKNKIRTVCITGAAGGIGRAIAIEMNKAGFNVACVDLNIEGLNNTIKLLKNGKTKNIALDKILNEMVLNSRVSCDSAVTCLRRHLLGNHRDDIGHAEVGRPPLPHLQISRVLVWDL